ncbi:zinc finger CCCH domain-containing protein 32-like isoform X3 [Magnolia sinica]|uniref:zinc finger CCCH domain-containing protein 32-like isoform X3 n=1 Tax=Magnolia sinica TaxID=86752 RepID=UPI002658492F|nr:zinc finger CCCH domain-containing protein 32-like isoform X3 [Magnolia sinica]
MEQMYGPNRPSMERSVSDPAASDWNSPAPEAGLEESMWQQMNLGGRDSYPERPGEPDCIYYMRTGFCGYGVRCRFNHPRDRSSVGGVLRGGGEYPERVGQPLCQFFMKTGSCKFGASCKFHHPRYGGGPASPVSLNYYGYPLRPGEKECSYYVKTGQCKFGVTCKFHHPQPTGLSMPAPAPAFYPTVQSPSVPSPPQYGGVASWQVARPPLIPGSYVQGPYGALMFSPGMVPIPGWSTYPGARPCSFYAQNGICKFGPTCKFDHPMGTLSYSPSASSLADMPVAPYPVGFSMAKLAPSSSSSELRTEFMAGSSKDSFSTRMPSSSDNTSSGSVGSIFSKGGGSVPQLHVQLLGQSSAPSSSSSSMGHGSESLGSS